MNEPRKLLPYEHQLIDALDISKEDYLDFVAQQHIYSDVKEGTVLDARGWPVVAIVLTVIGILLQVVAMLIAPKPDEGGGRTGTRDEIFAPRFGFNSLQELAKYGDSVNLVYVNTETNPDGAVRVATSLLWSAVQSYGNSQFVRLMLVVGAGGIGAIDPKRSAFGQLGMRDLVAQNYWLYFRPEGTGALRNRDLLDDPYGEIKTKDPTKTGGNGESPYRLRTRVADKNSAVEGFSHAYSPTSANTFGVYGVVPINVDIFIRNEKGDLQQSSNEITMSNWTNGGERVRRDDAFKITIAQVTAKDLDAEDPDNKNPASVEAAESRQSLASIFDNSGLVKFGSSKLKIIAVSRGNVIDGPMVVSLSCVEGGRGSSVAYDDIETQDVNALGALGLSGEYQEARTIARAILNEDTSRVRTGEVSILGSIKSGRIRKVYRTRERNLSEIVKQKQVARWSEEQEKNIRKRDLTATEIKTINTFLRLDKIKNDASSKDDYFYTKAIVRIEEASYETVSPCHIVDFSIRLKLFKRISGRAKEYGSERRKGWSDSDNGTKTRSAMFMLKYKKSSDNNFAYAPGIFIARRASDVDNYVFLRFNSGKSGIANAEDWQFAFEPVFDPAAEARSHPNLKSDAGPIRYFYLESASADQEVRRIGLPGPAFLEFAGTVRNAKEEVFPPINATPKGMNEWDLFANSSDNQVQFSFDNGPEFTLAAVTEQIIDAASNYPKLYKDLSLVGLNMYSGKTVQDLRSFTLMVTQGRRSRLLRRRNEVVNGIEWGKPNYQYLSPTANGFANTAPDIFIDTALDVNDGIGQFANVDSLDLEQLARSKQFCFKNKLFMDGIIAEPSSWRQFWATNAGFSLLELGRIGGTDALIPAVPYNRNTGEISTSIPIVALFNQGNILEGSYKEDFIDYGANVQDVIITAIYRKLDKNGMLPLKDSVDVQLADTQLPNGRDADVMRETVDLSNFVSRRDQAIMVGKFLCQVRRHSRRAIEFKTFPTDSPIAPGSYIYVELAHNQWNNIYSGTIEEGGQLNSPLAQQVPNGTYVMLVYKLGTEGTKKLSAVRIRDGVGVEIVEGQERPLTNYTGRLFVLGKEMGNRRVFRVVEVQMDEEGEVTVRGVEHGTDSNGQSLISRGLDPAKKIPCLFLIDGQDEVAGSNCR